MGRLDNIIARNRHPKQFGERLSVGIGLSLFILLILALMVFTDLGKHPEDVEPSAPARVDPVDRRVDDVMLRAPTPSGRR